MLFLIRNVHWIIFLNVTKTRYKIGFLNKFDRSLQNVFTPISTPLFSFDTLCCDILFTTRCWFFAWQQLIRSGFFILLTLLYRVEPNFHIDTIGTKFSWIEWRTKKCVKGMIFLESTSQSPPHLIMMKALPGISWNQI